MKKFNKHNELLQKKMNEFFEPRFEAVNKEVLSEVMASQYRFNHSVNDTLEYCNATLKRKIDEIVPELNKVFTDLILDEYNEKKLTLEEMTYILKKLSEKE